VVRQVQDLRKRSGLEVSDRIRLWLTGLDDLAGQFGFIAGEVLATDVLDAAGPGEGTLLELEGRDADAYAWLVRA